MPVSDLSYGYKQFSNPTTGDVWFPAMQSNLQQINDHDHDGATSARLASTVTAVVSANWGADLGGGVYRQLVAVPAGFTFDTCRIEVRRSTGEMAYPTIVKNSAGNFYLYTNDNTLAYNVAFL